MLVRLNGKEKISRPRTVGLALSGGGLRGAAHIGVLLALTRAGIPIDMIAGTSAGAVVAALYASGYSASQMIRMAAALNTSELIDLKVTVGDLVKHGFKWLVNGKFRFWSVLPAGFIKGDQIEAYLQDYLHTKTVRDTKIPLAITAVDLETGDTVFFVTPLPGNRAILNARYYYNTPLVEAVRASISIPGVFYPKQYRGMTLVDGAVKNNLPTDILRYMGSDVILAVDLGYDGQPVAEVKTVGEVLMQCIEIMGREVTLLKGIQYADAVIRPDVYGLNMKHSHYLEQAIERGEQAAQKKIYDIKQLL